MLKKDIFYVIKLYGEYDVLSLQYNLFLLKKNSCIIDYKDNIIFTDFKNYNHIIDYLKNNNIRFEVL